MDFGDSPDEAAFRQRLRTWVADNNPGLPASSTDDAYWAGQAAWHQSLYNAGFFGLSWPEEVGGQGLPSVYDVILDEELAAAGAPPRPGLGYLVLGILRHGSTEIQQRFLPGLVNGRERWCQGFSEPDAGSDLAALRTRADLDGDEYVLHGHKVWTSYSDDADWCLALARTDHEVPKHKGISAFIVPMDQPGIQQLPLKMINGITKDGRAGGILAAHAVERVGDRQNAPRHSRVACALRLPAQYSWRAVLPDLECGHGSLIANLFTTMESCPKPNAESQRSNRSRSFRSTVSVATRGSARPPGHCSSAPGTDRRCQIILRSTACHPASSMAMRDGDDE